MKLHLRGTGIRNPAAWWELPVTPHLMSRCNKRQTPSVGVVFHEQPDFLLAMKSSGDAIQISAELTMAVATYRQCLNAPPDTRAGLEGACVMPPDTRGATRQMIAGL